MERRLRVLAGLPWTVPVLILAFSQWEVWIAGPTHLVGPRWGAAVSMAVGSVLLVARRRTPLTAQVSAAVATAAPWLVWGASQIGTSFVIGVVSTYAVGRWGRRPAAYLGVPAAAAWALLQIARDPLQAGVAAGWGWALYAVMSWAGGAWVRQTTELSRRRDTERVAANRAELAEQRLGIARDLHDELANSLGVMVVHAEAAEEILAADPDRAAAAMRRVQTSGREALREVRALLGELRSDQSTADEPEAARDNVETGPRMGLGRLGLSDVDQLVGRMREAGLLLLVARQESRAVPPEVGDVIYRVLQECLTNTLRHAGRVPTQLRLDVSASSVAVEVINDEGFPGDQGLTTGGPTGGGLGLPGMRERVSQLGGTVQAVRRSRGGFAVRVEIPLDLGRGRRPDARRRLDPARLLEHPR